MLQTSAKTRSAGFSLLELLLVVAVGAVLILAGLGAYRLVSEGSATNRAVQQLSTLKQQVQQSFSGQGTYGAAAADLVATLTTMKALPSDMPTVNATTLRNAFSQNTTIVVGAVTNQFRIQFNGVPTSSCVQLAQTFTTANSSDLVSVTVGAAVLDTVAEFAIANITDQCDNAATQNMIWEFR